MGAAVAALVLLAGCAATPEPAPEAPAAASEVAACEVAPQAVLDAIGSGAQEGTGVAVKAGQMLLSPDFSKVYFVAATFSATGVADQVGTWATNDTAGTGLIMSVDGIAKNFTTWTDASTTDAAISGTDPSIDAVKGCLG